MTKPSEEGSNRFSDRRSSVRVRSLLPCAVRHIEPREIPRLEARILDMAVIESDGVLHDSSDWSERADDLPREVVFMLNEVRALRQQITEIQRLVERQSEGALSPRWMVINDRGFHFELAEEDPQLDIGHWLEVRVRIPSLHNPDVLAVGEVVRVDEDGGTRGAAIEFRAISQIHKQAILRYALRRERQLARSEKLTIKQNGE